jgi:putative ABC transport system permease protein
MRSGITTQALRRHRLSLLGPACTQVVAAAVVATMVDLSHSMDTSLSLAARAVPTVADVLDSASVFLGDAVYLSVVIVAVTMNLAIGRQLRDIALLRSIGASPGQIRRSVALQAAVLAVPASVIGAMLAVPLCAGWLTALRIHHVLPPRAAFSWDPASIVAAAGIVLATSIPASFIAALRTARMKPATALVDVGTGGRRITPLRMIIGIALVAAGVVLSIVLSTLAPSQMADAGVFVMLGECIGVGLLAPILLRRAAAICRFVIRDDLVAVAADELETLARALSGALIPLVLSGAFAAVKVGVHTSTAHAGVPDPAEARWMDYSGTATFIAFAAVAALNCFITVVVARQRELACLQLAGAARATVVRMVSMQAVIVTISALLLASAVAVITLLPLLHSTLHVWLPYFPADVMIAGVAAAGLVVAAGMVIPAAVLTRHRPIRVVAAS